MLVSTNIFLMGALTSLVSASAIALPAPEKQAPSIVCIYMCEHINFQGRCKDFCGSPGLCYNVPEEWNDIISSVRVPDSETSGCTLFPDINCSGRVNLEGLRGSQSNLVDVSFNDKASSWICY